MLTDEQWATVREAVELVMNREEDHVTAGPKQGDHVIYAHSAVHVSRKPLGGPYIGGVAIVIEPVNDWDLEPLEEDAPPDDE